MKKSLVIFGAAGVLLLGLMAVSAAPATNFAGIWQLDKSKSENVPRQWQNAESVTLVVTQDDKQLTVETKMTGGAAPGGAAQRQRHVVGHRRVQASRSGSA